ncbi:hypothetical protein SO802_005123 [Lithocarpus litseifolius]|uniref:Aminotransferase-like plant mobile domain-containing protein n=1 Tax=Lithocarpus litseifolius TaxID=425828 RepID=A0AAW2DLK0_9ROSI
MGAVVGRPSQPTKYWAWARFPYLCPTVEHGPLVGAYGPPVRGPLSLKWLWVPNKKNRPAHIFLKRYREQIASMLSGQPYEAELKDLPPWCVAGRAVWTATVPLVCFYLVELHTSDHVVRQFGMIQEIPRDVDTNTVLHQIDLRGKIEGYVRLLRRNPVGTEDHKDITDVLKAVQEIGRVQPPIPEASNEEATTPAAAATQRPSTAESPSTSTAPAGHHSSTCCYPSGCPYSRSLSIHPTSIP